MFRRKVSSLGLSCVLCIAALLFLSTSAAAADYSDVQGHWNAAVIEKWSDTGILSGYADGTFRPDAPVTRAQLASVLYRIWGVEPVQDGFDFPDLPKDHWCYDALNTMNMYGVVRNTGEKMLPDEPLTREEAFYMIGQTFSIGSPSGKKALSAVSDAGDISPQYVETIQDMMLDRYVNGSADGKLNPKRGITRAEVMKVIDNIVNVYITQPGVYQVHAKQNVLVTCGGVTLQRTDVPASYVNPRRTSYVRNYLFGSAAEGGVSFENRMVGEGTSTFYLYTVSKQAPSWQADARCEIRPQRRIFSTYVFPDTRFAAGSGKKDSPYLIASAEQFRLLAKCLDDTPLESKYFLLTRDLDLGVLSAPIGAEETDHSIHAHLDGGGHTVAYQMKNVTQTKASGGLFIYWVGSCSNLTLKGTADVTISESALEQKDFLFLPSNAVFFGGFSGYLEGKATNCTADMDITVRYRNSGQTYLEVGGWAGFSMGGQSKSFADCMATGSVKAVVSDQSTTVRAGGLLGMGTTSTVNPGYCEFRRCGVEGTVSVQGGNFTMSGGLVGQLVSSQNSWRDGENWAVVNCWSTAQVSGSGASFQCEAGGLVGQLYAGSVQQSWAKPTVTVNGGSYQNVGAIAGSCRQMGFISDCWANASGLSAGGDLHTGGIVGRLDQGSVSNCFTLGSGRLGGGNAIAFQSWNDGAVMASADMTGIAQSAKDLFLQSCGWDFADVWDKSGAYPLLRSCDPTAQRAAQA